MKIMKTTGIKWAVMALAMGLGTITPIQAQEDRPASLFAYLKVQPGMQKRFVAETQNVIERSRKEGGNLVYELQQSLKDPQLFAFYELFRSPDALIQHKNSKHVKHFLERVKPLLVPNGFVLDQYELLAPVGHPESETARNLTVKSDAIRNGVITGDQVFNGFGCSGGNISPDLNWKGQPEGTKSLAITVYDQDAPTGSGWWHWTVFNISPDISRINAGAGSSANNPLPNGAIEGRTDFGKPGYGGPCPPAGDRAHHYIIKVYALKDSIPLTQDASGAMVGFYIQQLKLAEGTLEARFGR